MSPPIPARYFDGRSAAEQQISLAIEPTGLRLFAASGASEADWPFAELEQIQGAAAPPLRLILRSLPDARLVIDDPTAIAAIAPRLPRRRDGPSLRLFAIGGIATAAVAVALWLLAPIVTRLAANLVPASLESKWGEKVGAELLAQSWICIADDGRRALKALTDRLAAGHPAAAGNSFDVIVKHDPMVNAFALPGGRIVIMDGLLKQADGGDEVAGVLAHEIGHVIARHAVEKMIWREAVSFGAALLMGETYGVSVAQFLVNQAHSRDAEREADRYAIELLTQAGIATAGFATFFDRQMTSAPSLPGAGLISYLSSHPPDLERRAVAKAAGPAQTKPALTDDEWRALKNICTVRRQP